MCGNSPGITSTGRWACDQPDHLIAGPEKDSEGEEWDKLQRLLAAKCESDHATNPLDKRDDFG